jgi:Reverse transcriptase (RNA-dependent DNA polymerase)
VITDMYRDVRSAIKIDGTHSKWFRSLLGVRQGSVLSPTLFSLFINGLVKWLMNRGFGIEIGGKRVRGTRTRVGARRLALLLFADDIVLLASTDAELRAMLEAVEAYACRWRLAFNGDKCEVMETCTKRAVGNGNGKEPWHIASTTMRDSESAKYLGVDLQRNGKWDQHMARLTAKASQRLPQLWRVGASSRGLRTRTACHLAELLIRPVLEYGCEVIWPTKAQQLESERVMLNAARIITGAERHTLSDALRGELGWRSMSELRALKQLNYFHRLRTMPVDRLAAWLFRQRMEHTADRVPIPNVKVPIGGVMGFCEGIRLLMIRWDIASEWQSTTSHTKATWTAKMEIVKERMNKQWQQRMSAKTKGRWYSSIKQMWGQEQYLNDAATGTRRMGGQWKLRIRCLSVELNAIRFRERRVGLLSPACTVCTTGDDETIAHFMLSCPRYEDLRAAMLFVASITANARHRNDEQKNGDRGSDSVLSSKAKQWSDMSNDERVIMLLTEDGKIDHLVKVFLSSAFQLRRAIVRPRVSG